MAATRPGKAFQTIQILRGLAALIVVLFHLTLTHARREQEVLIGGVFQNGFAGVDLFFVISGFVIMHTSHLYFNKPDYFITYVRKRFIRIYPIYWLTLILIISGVLVVELVTQKSTNYLLNSHRLMSTFLLLPNHTNLNGVTWSLSHELYYYLVFGLLILSRRFWPFVALIVVLSGVSILHPDLVNYPLLTNFFFSPYNLEFASGILVWWLVDRYQVELPVCFLLLAVAFVWLLAQGSIPREEVPERVVLYGFSCFLIVLSLTELECNNWLKPSSISRMLAKIGDASYLIYIIHFPFLPFYGRLLVFLQLTVAGQHVAAILFTSILTTGCIYLHKHVELPLVKRLNQYVLTPPHSNNG